MQKASPPLLTEKKEEVVNLGKAVSEIAKREPTQQRPSSAIPGTKPTVVSAPKLPEPVPIPRVVTSTPAQQRLSQIPS